MSNLDIAVILQKNLPQEIELLLSGYLLDEGGIRYLHAKNVEHIASFVSVSAFSADSEQKIFNVQIPVGFVLAIADMSGHKQPFGFVPSKQ